MTDFMTPRQAAKALGVSHTTVIRHIKANKLPAWRVGSLYRIERAAVEAHLKPIGRG